MRFVHAFFSPLRDPFYKDWLFYVFALFELALIANVIETESDFVSGIFSLIIGTLLYWAIFVFGGAKLRNPGLPLFMGVERVKKGSLQNLKSHQHEEVDLTDIQGNLKKYSEKSKDYLLDAFQTGSGKLEAYINATIVLSALKPNGGENLHARLFGPVWFQYSELKREQAASFCLTDDGLFIVSWRKRPNALLDFWFTHLSEIKNVEIAGNSEATLRTGVSQRVNGNTSGRLMGETISISPRIERDLEINEIALIGFYSLLSEIL